MDQVTTAIKSALKPIQALYNKAFDANKYVAGVGLSVLITCLLYTSPSPRDAHESRMPSSA